MQKHKPSFGCAGGVINRRTDWWRLYRPNLRPVRCEVSVAVLFQPELKTKQLPWTELSTAVNQLETPTRALTVASKPRYTVRRIRCSYPVRLSVSRQTKSTYSFLDSFYESLAQNSSRRSCVKQPDLIGVILRRRFAISFPSQSGIHCPNRKKIFRAVGGILSFLGSPKKHKCKKSSNKFFKR